MIGGVYDDRFLVKPTRSAMAMLPDSGIMLKLCELLGINVNELLSGERIMSEIYDKRAEENLLAMKREVEEKNRQMLRTEYMIALLALTAGLVMVLVAALVEMPGMREVQLAEKCIVLGRCG